jgi:hypothetical protein
MKRAAVWLACILGSVCVSTVAFSEKVEPPQHQYAASTVLSATTPVTTRQITPDDFAGQPVTEASSITGLGCEIRRIVPALTRVAERVGLVSDTGNDENWLALTCQAARGSLDPSHVKLEDVQGGDVRITADPGNILHVIVPDRRGIEGSIESDGTTYRFEWLYRGFEITRVRTVAEDEACNALYREKVATLTRDLSVKSALRPYDSDRAYGKRTFQPLNLCQTAAQGSWALSVKKVRSVHQAGSLSGFWFDADVVYITLQGESKSKPIGRFFASIGDFYISTKVIDDDGDRKDEYHTSIDTRSSVAGLQKIVTNIWTAPDGLPKAFSIP